MRVVGLNTRGREMVLDVEHKDKYAPLVTGIHTVYLNEKKEGEKSQRFWYNEATH